MKERPILFSGQMVKAILEGKKTQTRRIVKPQPVYLPQFTMWGWKEAAGGGYEVCWKGDMPEAISEYCPYGRPGDHLWVRETHLVTGGGAVLYKADHPDLISGYCRPSIHMLRQHSRITLEIVATSVQRLQYISDTDIVAEGIDYMIEKDGSLSTTFNRQAFANLWDKINGRREGCAWKNNPWVWVVDFSRI